MLSFEKKYISISELLILILKTSVGYFFFFLIIFSIPYSQIKEYYLKLTHERPKIDMMVIGDAKINLEIVTTPEDKSIGLSKYEQMPVNTGMFFVFDTNDFYHIWMKDMNFSIDILWLSESLEVIDMKPNIKPNTYPQTFTSKEEARYVLEVQAGFIEKNGIKLHDQATIMKKF